MPAAATETRQLLPGRDYLLETVPCVCCGSTRYEIHLKGARELYNGFDAHFDVVRCLDCGHLFTNPRPTPETIGCFYPDSARYYQPKAGRVTGKGEARSRLRRSILGNYFGYSFPRLPKVIDFLPYLRLRRRLLLAHMPRFVPGGRLLDIGCAWGGYLTRMRSLGWEVEGVEMNASAAEYARQELDLDVRAGSFDDSDFAEVSFDVIHMSMVLEHLFDPLGALKRIHRVLKPGGQFILSVPDISGFEARLFGKKAYTLQVPQHLSHFTPVTITRFLHQAGFCVERILHQKSKSDFVKSADYLEDGILRRLLQGRLVKGVILRPLVALLARFGRTSRMSIYAIKREAA